MKSTFIITAQYICALIIAIVLLGIPTIGPFMHSNIPIQAALFLLGACIPAFITGRMSFVDFAWPWGLVGIGIQLFLLSEDKSPQVAVISLIYLTMGLRMGIWAVVMGLKGENKELPRYQYQRLRWAQAGYQTEKVPMQFEIILQAIANMTVLALPGTLIAFENKTSLSFVTISGFAIWLISYSLESISDLQKQRFVTESNRLGSGLRTCNVGLWRYSRHPNYFFQWMGWNALVLAALPSLFTLRHQVSPLPWAVLFLGLLSASGIMYYTLVYFTGAVPAEYYSLRKRPEYAEYQRSTPMFFFGFKKK